MAKLWQKNWQLNTMVEKFETKDDLILDAALVESDILGSLAHAKGLTKIGILTPKEFQKLQQGLKTIWKLNKQGKFKLKFGDEDIHTKIENFLTKKYGIAGKKIHTGRSRNDQVLTALLLYTKEQLLTIWGQAIELAEAFLGFAKKYGLVPMPGYTHMQKAMPTSVGMWATAFAEGILDSLEIIQTAYTLNDQSPLGSGAGYGVPIPLPREYTAKLLGFRTVQKNPMSCQNSRGKIEAATVGSLITLQNDINKFATDVMLFTTSEFGFMSVAPELCSGSSLMPQKKNVDIAELLRAKIHVLLGHYGAIIGVCSNLPLGYNRDLQDTKKPLIESLTIANESLIVAKLLVEHLAPDQAALKKAMTPELYATHHALSLVKKGVPFRDAYRQVAGKKPKEKFVGKKEKNQNHIKGTNKKIQKTKHTQQTLYKNWQKAKAKLLDKNI
ncbi:MAG: argininosuccinate lyase [Patescibacteria group bacterium]